MAHGRTQTLHRRSEATVGRDTRVTTVPEPDSCAVPVQDLIKRRDTPHHGHRWRPQRKDGARAYQVEDPLHFGRGPNIGQAKYVGVQAQQVTRSLSPGPYMTQRTRRKTKREQNPIKRERERESWRCLPDHLAKQASWRWIPLSTPARCATTNSDVVPTQSARPPECGLDNPRESIRRQTRLDRTREAAG